MPTLKILPDNVVVRHVYVPPGHDERLPENTYEVLERAHDLLAEEGKWTCGTEHRGLNGRDDPYCGSWSACAVGACSLVAYGVVDAYPSQDTPTWCYTDGLDAKVPDGSALLYQRACRLLDLASGGSIVNKNDGGMGRRYSETAQEHEARKIERRDEVLQYFKKAMKMAETFDRDRRDWSFI